MAVHNAHRDTATETHTPYAIIQCYLPPGRCDGNIPAFRPSKAVARFCNPEDMQGLS